jgi:hypothetical protein
VERAFVPEVRQVGPEGPEALGGELPVERLWEVDDYEGSRRLPATWLKSSKGS